MAGLHTEVAVEVHPREEVAGLDANPRGGSGQRAFGGTDVRPPAQQFSRVANIDERWQGRNGGRRGKLRFQRSGLLSGENAQPIDGVFDGGFHRRNQG